MDMGKEKIEPNFESGKESFYLKLKKFTGFIFNQEKILPTHNKEYQINFPQDDTLKIGDETKYLEGSFRISTVIIDDEVVVRTFPPKKRVSNKWPATFQNGMTVQGLDKNEQAHNTTQLDSLIPDYKKEMFMKKLTIMLNETFYGKSFNDSGTGFIFEMTIHPQPNERTYPRTYDLLLQGTHNAAPLPMLQVNPIFSDGIFTLQLTCLPSAGSLSEQIKERICQALFASIQKGFPAPKYVTYGTNMPNQPSIYNWNWKPEPDFFLQDKNLAGFREKLVDIINFLYSCRTSNKTATSFFLEVVKLSKAMKIEARQLGLELGMTDLPTDRQRTPQEVVQLAASLLSGFVEGYQDTFWSEGLDSYVADLNHFLSTLLDIKS